MEESQRVVTSLFIRSKLSLSCMSVELTDERIYETHTPQEYEERQTSPCTLSKEEIIGNISIETKGRGETIEQVLCITNMIEDVEQTQFRGIVSGRMRIATNIRMLTA